MKKLKRVIGLLLAFFLFFEACVGDGPIIQAKEKKHQNSKVSVLYYDDDDEDYDDEEDYYDDEDDYDYEDYYGTTVWVPTVTFSKSSGVYKNAFSLELSNQDGNKIYYSVSTLNGTDSGYQVYSGPISVSETCTITTYASDSSGEESSKTSATYTMLSEMAFQKEKVSLTEFKSMDMTKILSVSGSSISGIYSDLNWTSSNTNVASVSYYGTVSAKSAGTTVITAKTEDGYSASCTVKVTASPISITKSKKVKVGNSVTLSISPEACRSRVKWKSSNKKVATVNQSGKVVAKAPGTCTITATYGTQKKKCKITVPKVKIKLNAKKITVGYKKVKNLKVSTNLNKNLIKWKTSNAKVAKIASNGKIIPMGAGTCKITAYYKKYKASCKVKIPASVVKVPAPKRISTKKDVYYDYIEKHGIQVGDCYSLKVNWSKVAHAAGYEVKVYWKSYDEIVSKSVNTVNVEKINGKYYYSYTGRTFKTIKDLAHFRGSYSFFSKKLLFYVSGGTCEEVYKISIRSYRTINGKRFYSKAKTIKVKN